MFLILFLLLAILILIKKELAIPIYIVCVLWINPDIRILGLTFINLLSIYIIFWIFISTKNKKNDINLLIRNFFIYYIVCNIIFIFLSNGLPISDQISSSKSVIINLVAFSLWNIRISREEITKHYNFFLIPLLALCVYGIYSYITQSNTYVDLISPYTQQDLVSRAERSIADGRGSLYGRITGTSLYTIQYGVLMSIIFYYFVFLYKFNKKKTIIGKIILLGIIINIYLTGSRGPLFALFVSLVLYYILNSGLFKQKIIILFFCLFLLFILLKSDSGFISLFTSDDVQGSSINGRILQFLAALSIVTDSPISLLFGKGQGFTNYYIETYGSYTLANEFEGAIISGIVNYGVLGVIFIYFGQYIFLYYILKKAKKTGLINCDGYYFLVAFIFFNFICSFVVGGVYTNLFFVIYFIILRYSILLKNVDIYK